MSRILKIKANLKINAYFIKVCKLKKMNRKYAARQVHNKLLQAGV